MSITVGELKQILAVQDDNLKVRLVTGHGNCAMSLTGYGESHIEEEIYMAEEVDDDYIEDYPDAVKVFILEGF